MPPIVRDLQQDVRCAQTYPQKMGIDNSRAAEQQLGKKWKIFSVETSSAETGRRGSKKKVGGARTYRE
jgi:hypothetical protein